MRTFENKIVMVTGAGRNIGRQIALDFAEQGACVIVCDLKDELASGTCAEIEAMGGKAYKAVFDVRDREKIFATVADVTEKLGGVDILVNNAGGSAGLIGKLTNFVDAEESTVDFVLDVNLKGSINCIQAVLPHMIEQKFGRIINMSSIAAICGIQQRADYSAAKAGLIGLTRSLAMEVGRYNVTVNCVAPGAIEHDGQGHHDHWTYIGENGRGGTHKEIANAVLFLASQEFITGQNYQVDGGRTLGPGNL